jgi:NAD(P)H-hydrate epimerase
MSNAAAAVVGPGLGNAESTAAFIQGLLLTKPLSDVPVVIDADALNALSITYGWEQHLVVDAVLTPHPGEMGRLLAINVQAVQEDRIAAAVTGSQRWRQVVVLKGAHTIVAAPDGRVAVSPFANPALGSAGTGDVLAGIIGALLAQGLACFAAAVVGVYLHGLAGERWRADNGDAGLLASDLLPLLPRVAQEVRRT